MKKYIIISIIIIALLIISFFILRPVIYIGGYFLTYYFGCEYKINKYIDSVVESQDLSYCKSENIIENLEKVECFKPVSNPSRTRASCPKKSGIIRSYCYSTDAESWCYRRFAQNNLDVEICNKMSDNSASNPQWAYCLRDIAREKQDYTICDNIETPSKAACYGDIARIKKDPNICFFLSSEHNLESTPINGSTKRSATSESGVCLDYLWLDRSIEKQSCEDIADEENRDTCYESYDNSTFR